MRELRPKPAPGLRRLPSSLARPAPGDDQQDQLGNEALIERLRAENPLHSNRSTSSPRPGKSPGSGQGGVDAGGGFLFGIERDGVGVGARGRGRAKANKGGIALGGGGRLGMWGELSTSTESASLKADAMVGAAGGVDGGIGANEIGGEAEAFVGAKMGIEGRAGDEERASAGLRGEGWVGAGAKSKARLTFENGNLRGELGAGAGLGVGGYGEVSGSVNVGRIADNATAAGEQVGTAAEEERRRGEEEARRRAEEERRQRRRGG